MFQSSIAPKGNRYFSTKNYCLSSHSQVSILDRPEGQSLLISMPISTSFVRFTFQSSIAPKGNRYEYKCFIAVAQSVSILDRPEGQSLRNCQQPQRYQRYQVSILDRPEGQSLLWYEIAINTWLLDVSILDRPEGQSLLILNLVSLLNASFNPRSPRRAIATHKWRKASSTRNVSILDRPEGQSLLRAYELLLLTSLLFQSSIAPKGNRYSPSLSKLCEGREFQSSIAPKGNRYLLGGKLAKWLNKVSILDRPEGQSLLG